MENIKSSGDKSINSELNFSKIFLSIILIDKWGWGGEGESHKSQITDITNLKRNVKRKMRK